MALDKFKYNGKIIKYAGFKLENKYCFYSNEDYIIYLSKTQFHKLEKIEKTEEELLEELEVEEYFKDGI